MAASPATPFRLLSRRRDPEAGLRRTPPTRRPTLPPPSAPPPARGRVKPAVAEHGRAQPGRRAPSHGRRPLSDPAWPGAGRGEAPETPRDRVSPRALPGPPAGGCVPARSSSARASVPRAGKAGGPRAPAGAQGLRGWRVRHPVRSSALRGALGAPGHDPTDKIEPRRGSCPAPLLSGRVGAGDPEFVRTLTSRKTHVSLRALKRSHLQGGVDGRKGLESPR